MKNKNLKRSEVKVGDKVTCKHPVEAYYSDYGVYKGTIMVFRPGMVGVVAAIAPKVRLTPADESHDRKADFLVVDYDCPITNQQQRVGLNFINTVKIEEKV